MPIQKAKLVNWNLPKSKITAAAVIGVASKNEYLAAPSLSIPNALATVIVIPERETPGNAAAKHCDVPISIDCFSVIFSYFIFDFNLITFIFIPAIISIILDMKYDKNTAFMATFGAFFVGIIGSTIS